MTRTLKQLRMLYVYSIRELERVLQYVISKRVT